MKIKGSQFFARLESAVAYFFNELTYANGGKRTEFAESIVVYLDDRIFATRYFYVVYGHAVSTYALGIVDAFDNDSIGKF